MRLGRAPERAEEREYERHDEQQEEELRKSHTAADGEDQKQ